MDLMRAPTSSVICYVVFMIRSAFWASLYLLGNVSSSGAFVDILVSGTLSNPQTSFVRLSQAHAVYWHELSAGAMAGHESGYWKIAPDSLLAECTYAIDVLVR